MKKRTIKNKCAAADKTEFKTRYAELVVRVKAIKAKLKDALKDANVLSKDAFALRRFGNENLYAKDNRGIHPAFPSLPRKMGMLEHWEDIRFDISDTVANC